MEIKKLVLYLSYPVIIILSFALERSVEDTEWFKNLVGMLKTSNFRFSVKTL